MQKLISGESVEAIVLVDPAGNIIGFDATGQTKSSNAVGAKSDATTTVKTILASNPNRKGVPSVYYDDAAIMYLLAGDGIPGPDNFTIKLGQNLPTFFEPSVLNYTGPLKAIWSAATGSAKVTEYL